MRQKRADNMTIRQARLVTRAELVKRLRGRSKARVYADCQEGGRLRPTMVPDGRVDLEHPDAKIYCAQYDYHEPDTAEIAASIREKERQKAKAPTAPPTQATQIYDVEPNLSADAAAAEFEDSDDKTAHEIMGMTLSELSARYGKQSQFLDYVKALKVLTDTRAKDEDAARRRKEHVPMSLVLALVGQIDALQTALLSETTVAIRNKVTAMVKAGADQKVIEKSVHDLISRTIRTTKSSTERAIRSVYDPR